MDGQRRISKSLRRLRRRAALWLASSRAPLGVRRMARLGAMGCIGVSILAGLADGGHFRYEGSPYAAFADRLAFRAGLAASDIKITGLVHHKPEQLLGPLGIEPGASLIWFNAEKARRILEAQDWVASASIQRGFPNQLQIAVVEREPAALWQVGGKYHVIDQDGAVISGIQLADVQNLTLITGEGGNTAARELLAGLMAYPDLMVRVASVTRVGNRRWNLYLDDGSRVLLPQQDFEAALKRLTDLDAAHRLLSLGLREIDLRVAGQMFVALPSQYSSASNNVIPPRDSN
jgi:cell division protein FtsQ